MNHVTDKRLYALYNDLLEHYYTDYKDWSHRAIWWWLIWSELERRKSIKPCNSYNKY